MDIEKTIENIGIVPVIVINDAKQAEGLAKALLDGGIPCAEVTFRTDAAEEAMKRISAKYPKMILGAGTVVTEEQAKRAVNAGAKFLVSPGYDQKLVDWAAQHKVPYFPGVCTASEVQVAVANGFKVLKFFPAEAAGGTAMLKNLCGPFPQVKFMTTGGISASNLADYAASPHVLAVGGSWMAKADMIADGKWEEITALCRQAVTAIHGFSIAHIGLNASGTDDAAGIAARFALFGYQTNVGNASTFMDKAIEIMHNNGRGKHGHIGFRTYNVDRAAAYLSNFGFTICPETVKKDAKGNMTFCYMNEEIGGFAIHLIK